MRKHIAVAATAMALALSATQAFAESKGYIISNWAPAMNNVDDSGCPNGRNAAAQEIMTYVLKNQGMPQDQIEKIVAPDAMTQDAFVEYGAMRGRKDGKAVNVYSHPTRVPDPQIKLELSKEGFGFNLDGKVSPTDYTDPLTKQAGVDNMAARVSSAALTARAARWKRLRATGRTAGATTSKAIPGCWRSRTTATSR